MSGRIRMTRPLSNGLSMEVKIRFGISKKQSGKLGSYVSWFEGVLVLLFLHFLSILFPILDYLFIFQNVTL